MIVDLRGEESIVELYREEGINQNLYYRCSKGFNETGKKRLAGDATHEAASDELRRLRPEIHQPKDLLPELMVENRLLKKASTASGVRYTSYSASEKLEFIRLDEQPSWSMRPSLSQLGIPPSTFYAWYEYYPARWTLLHFPSSFDMRPSTLPLHGLYS